MKKTKVLMVSKKSYIPHSQGKFNLEKGDMVVIPKGVEHKPLCETECHLLLIEPVKTLNTGDKVTDETDIELEWI